MTTFLIWALIILIVIILIIIGITIYRMIYNKKLNERLKQENEIIENGGVPERKTKKLGSLGTIGGAAGLLCICLSIMSVTLSCTYRLSNENSYLQNRLTQLENNIRNLLSQQTYEQRKANSLLTGFSCSADYENIDYVNYTIPIDIAIQPKEISDNTIVKLRIGTEIFDTENNNGSFTLRLINGIFDNSLSNYPSYGDVIVNITDNGVTKTENLTNSSLYDYYSLYSAYQYELAPVLCSFGYYNSKNTITLNNRRKEATLDFNIEIEAESNKEHPITKAVANIFINDKKVYEVEFNCVNNDYAIQSTKNHDFYLLKVNDTVENIEKLDSYKVCLHLENDLFITEYVIQDENYINPEQFLPYETIMDKNGNILMVDGERSEKSR